MKRKITVFILLILPMVTVLSLDFGLVTNQSADISNDANGDTVFEYSGGFIPRLTTPVGENGDLFVSASFTLNYADKFGFIPELLQTEYSNSFGAWNFSMGRFSYADPMSMVANGLFDGVQFRHSSTLGRFGFGAWYTGLQYKGSANITMTANDLAVYNEELDYSKFAGTYFASKRVLAAFEWGHPALKEFLQINASLIGQFDLNSGQNKLHSEYLILKLGIPLGNLFLEAGGIFQAAQAESGSDYESYFALAGELSALYRLPTSFNSSILLAANYSGAQTSGDITAFIPVSTQYQGEVFQVKQSGLTSIKLNYSGRFTETVGASVGASYFIRNDLVTANSYPYGAGSDGYLLGSEFSGRVIWSPFSDLQLILGGGFFVPSLGNVWKDESVLWKLNFTMVLGVY